MPKNVNLFGYKYSYYYPPKFHAIHALYSNSPSKKSQGDWENEFILSDVIVDLIDKNEILKAET